MWSEVLVWAGIFGLVSGATGAWLYSLTLSRRISSAELDLTALQARLLSVMRTSAANKRWEPNQVISGVPSSFPADQAKVLSPTEFLKRKWGGIAPKRGGA